MPHNHFTFPRPFQVCTKLHKRLITFLSQVAMFGNRVQHEAPGNHLLQEVEILHNVGQSLYGETKYLSDLVKYQGVDAVSSNEALVTRYNIANYRLKMVAEKLNLLKNQLKDMNAHAMMRNAGGSQPIDGGQLMTSQNSHGQSLMMIMWAILFVLLLILTIVFPIAFNLFSSKPDEIKLTPQALSCLKLHKLELYSQARRLHQTNDHVCPRWRIFRKRHYFHTSSRSSVTQVRFASCVGFENTKN